VSAAIERALAQLRAIPTKKRTEETPAAASSESCCGGDRSGYQWHQRTGNLPACAAALEAQRAYGREYLRKWRAKNPGYQRRWRAQQRAKGGAS
jgi:hypothetical protein